MPRQPKAKNVGGAKSVMENVTVPDMTKEIYPAGVPTNDDGSIATEIDIPVEQAQKIGALTAESAQSNLENARKIKAAKSGEKVRWDEKDARALFEQMKVSYAGGSNIMIHVSRVEPTPEDYRPFWMRDVRDVIAFYDYIERHIHKNSPAATYKIMFKEGQGNLQRGSAYLRMLDATQIEAAKPEAPHMYPPPIYPPHYMQQYGYPPPQQQQPYGYPPGYGPQQQQMPMQAPPAPAPQPAPAPSRPVAEAAPPVPSLSIQQPQPAYYQPDPMIAGNLAAQYQETQRMQELLRQNQLQIQQMLGEVMAQRQSQGQLSVQPAQFQAPPQVQQQTISLGLIDAHMPQDMQARIMGELMTGTDPNVFETYAKMFDGLYPMAAANLRKKAANIRAMLPPPTPAAVAQPPQQVQSPYPPMPHAVFGVPTPPAAPTDPVGQMQQMVAMISGLTRAVGDIRSAVGIENEAPDLAEPPAPPAPDPITTVPLGVGPHAAMMALNTATGALNPVGTILANMHSIPGWLNGVGDFMIKAARAQQQQNMPQENVVEMPQQHQQLPVQTTPQPQPQPQYRPPAPVQHVQHVQPAQPVQQQRVFAPPAGDLRSILGGG